MLLLWMTALLLSLQEAESKFRMVTSMWSMLDFCAFAPPLVEAILMHGARLPFKLGRFDFRWFKILRCVIHLSHSRLIILQPAQMSPNKGHQQPYH